MNRLRLRTWTEAEEYQIGYPIRVEFEFQSVVLPLWREPNSQRIEVQIVKAAARSVLGGKFGIVGDAEVLSSCISALPATGTEQEIESTVAGITVKIGWSAVSALEGNKPGIIVHDLADRPLSRRRRTVRPRGEATRWRMTGRS